MGPEYNQKGIQNRVFQHSSARRSFQNNSYSEVKRTTPSSRKGDLRPVTKEGDLQGRRIQTKPISLLIFPDAEEARCLEANNKPEASQQSLHPAPEVQNGNFGHRTSLSRPGSLGHINRLEGRLPSYSDPPSLPQISGVPLQGNRLRLQGSTLRPFHGSSGLHKSNKGRPGFPAKKRHISFRLPGRLASSRPLSPRVDRHHQLHRVSSGRLGMDRKSREIIPDPKPNPDVPRRCPGPQNRPSLSFSTESSGPPRHSLVSRLSSQGSSETLAPCARTDGEYGRCSSLLPTVYETDPDPPSQPLLPVTGPFNQEGISVSCGQTTSSMVDSSTQCGSREIHQGTQTDFHDYDGCLSDGMGSGLEIRDDGRRMVPGRLNSPHQCLRVDGHSQSNPDLGCETGEPSGLDPVRQLHNSRLYQPPGRNQVQDSLPEDLGTSPPMPQLQYSHQGLSSSGAGQFHGRRPFQRQPSGNRVVTFTNMGQQSVSHLREAGGGPLRLSSQPQTPTLLHEVLPSRSLGGRRSINPVGQLVPLCLPSVVSDSEGSQQTQPIRDYDPPDSSVLAEPTVVSNAPGDARRPSIQVPSSSGAPVSRQGQNPAPAPQPHTLVSLEIIKQHLAGEGLSQEAASIASQSRRRSTLSTYDSRLAKFREWSSEKNLNPMETSVKDIADFLTSLFNEGKQVATIRNYRSAIASIHKGFPDGSNISSNPAISQLLKGMFNQRPPRRNLVPSWSINDVLSSLSRPPYEPMHNTTLEFLTYKTLFLVAAASARRRSELHALTTRKGFIRFSNAGAYLIPDAQFLTKNETISFTPGEIYLPTISSPSSVGEDRKVCPVRALKWYLERTKDIRQGDKLFILPRRPYTAAAKDTLARWLVNLISPFSEPDEPVHAHQLRAHATSTAWFRGISLNDIMKAAAWKTPSTFVASYLTDVVSEEGAFARAVLGVPDRRRPARC